MTVARQKLLFVCSRNRWRSPTAEHVFARSQRFAVRARGLRAKGARKLGGADITWADVIFVMEPEHKEQLLELYRDAVQHRRIHVLDIPDKYQFMDPELVDLITSGVEAVVGPS